MDPALQQLLVEASRRPQFKRTAPPGAAVGHADIKSCGDSIELYYDQGQYFFDGSGCSLSMGTGEMICKVLNQEAECSREQLIQWSQEGYGKLDHAPVGDGLQALIALDRELQGLPMRRRCFELPFRALAQL